MNSNTSISLYPLKFIPKFTPKPWGGNRISAEFKFLKVPDEKIGEAWLLSAVKGKETVVDNGFLKGSTIQEVYEVFNEELVGEKGYELYPDAFPLLIKIIDANEWLSVQVHPDDELAGQRYNQGGKTEMWYILDAQPEAKLISGFEREIDKNALVFLAENGLLPDVMHYEDVKAGDVFFTPAGRIHAIGPGILLAEIQQTSDVTYRIYDWGRKDKDGKSRETHLMESLDAVDFEVTENALTEYERKENGSSSIARCNYFNVNKVNAIDTILKDYTEIDSFVALIFTQGEGVLHSEHYVVPYTKGELILLPAITNLIEIFPTTHTEILEVYLPDE